MGKAKIKDNGTRFSISKKGDRYATLNGGGVSLADIVGYDRVLIKIEQENGRHILHFIPSNCEGSMQISPDKQSNGWHTNAPATIAKTLRTYTGFLYRKLSKVKIENSMGVFYEVLVDLDDRTEDKREPIVCADKDREYEVALMEVIFTELKGYDTLEKLRKTIYGEENYAK